MEIPVVNVFILFGILNCEHHATSTKVFLFCINSRFALPGYSEFTARIKGRSFIVQKNLRGSILKLMYMQKKKTEVNVSSKYTQPEFHMILSG
jgi:hypothetical protein